MLVLLPPSETRASGGDGPPLRLDTLSHPELTPTRRKLVDELVRLAGDVSTGRVALNLSERQVGELARNAELWNAPTLPALHRYTGVLYAALDAGLLRARAVANAVTVRVLCVDGDGRRRPVSHHNKAHKGRLARLLATAPHGVSDADGVARIAHRAGCGRSAPASTRWISSCRSDPSGIRLPTTRESGHTLYVTMTAGVRAAGGGGRPWLPVVFSST